MKRILTVLGIVFLGGFLSCTKDCNCLVYDPPPPVYYYYYVPTVQSKFQCTSEQYSNEKNGNVWFYTTDMIRFFPYYGKDTRGIGWYSCASIPLPSNISTAYRGQYALNQIQQRGYAVVGWVAQASNYPKEMVLDSTQ